MDVRKLEAFCKVYELENFSKAGEVMFLSQPTISSHVANLEDELGVRLFDRMGRKVMPTEAGHVLYRSAVLVFRNLSEAKASIEMLRDNVVGDLQIGASTIPAHHIVPGLLADFSRSYPDVSFTVKTSDSADVIKRVVDGDLPMGIVGYEPSEEGLHADLLMEDETAVIVGTTASFLNQAENLVGIETLVDYPWVMREKGSATREVLEQALRGVGKSMHDLNIRSRVEGTCEALAHTIAGVGVSMTSLVASSDLIKAGVVRRLDVPELRGRRRFYIIYHSERHMFPALRTFVDYALSRK